MWERHEAYFHIVQRVILLLLAADLLLMTVGADLLPTPEEARVAEIALPLDAVPVRSESGGLFGNVHILSEDNVSLDRAYLLINGERVGDFGAGEITMRVYPGDILSIDASAYRRAIYFYLDSYSTAIDGAYLRASVICNGDTADLGTVVFK